MGSKLKKKDYIRIENYKRTKKKLFITLMSMMGALALMAVGAFASATSFDATISNNINIRVGFMEGSLWVRQMGGIYSSGDNIGEQASLANTLLYSTQDGTVDTAISALQSTDINVDKDNNNIRYIFQYIRDVNAIGDAYITLSELSGDFYTNDSDNITINYKYNYGTSYVEQSSIVLDNNDTIVVNADDPEVFILCELVADTSTTINVQDKVWSFRLDFETTEPLPAPDATIEDDELIITPLTGAVKYNVYAIASAPLGGTSLRQSAQKADNNNSYINQSSFIQPELGDTVDELGLFIANSSSPKVNLFTNAHLLDGITYIIRVAGVDIDNNVGLVKTINTSYTMEKCTKFVLDVAADLYPTVRTIGIIPMQGITELLVNSGNNTNNDSYAIGSSDYGVVKTISYYYSNPGSYTIKLKTVGAGTYKLASSNYNGIQLFSSNDDKLTEIGDNTFYGCTNLDSVIIPNYVTIIGEGAFAGCSGLTSITIPDRVAIIKESAFEACTNLANIIIPNSGLATIDDKAFTGCTSLISVTIPNTVVRVGLEAFYGCNSLNNVTIEDGLGDMIIDQRAFSSCANLETVIIGDGVTEIGDDAFYECVKLSSVTFGNHLIRIGALAFAGCEADGLGSYIFEDTSTWYITTNNTYSDGNQINVENGVVNKVNLIDNSEKYWYKV